MATTSSIQRVSHLNYHLIQNPAKIAQKERIKSLAWNVLSKICLVAFLAITTAVLAVAFGILTLSGYMPLLFLGLVFISIPLNMFAPKFHVYAREHHLAFIRENLVATKLNELENGQPEKDQPKWSEDDVRAFYKKYKLSMENLPLDELKKLNEHSPLKALLPVIARFESYWDIAESTNQQAIKDLEQQIKPPADKKVSLEEIRGQKLDFRRNGWSKKEACAYPAALNGDFMLKIAEFPSMQETEISDLALILSKNLEERLTERQFDNDDSYLLPKKGAALRPLSLQEVESAFTRGALKEKMWPSSPPANV